MLEIEQVELNMIKIILALIQHVTVLVTLLVLTFVVKCAAYFTLQHVTMVDMTYGNEIKDTYNAF